MYVAASLAVTSIRDRLEGPAEITEERLLPECLGSSPACSVSLWVSASVMHIEFGLTEESQCSLSGAACGALRLRLMQHHRMKSMIKRRTTHPITTVRTIGRSDACAVVVSLVIVDAEGTKVNVTVPAEVSTI